MTIKNVTVKETNAKSILRKRKKIDSWFLSHYGMNLYRGCTHNCTYCDGRTEKYYVDGEFGRDVEVKINAPQILKHELDPKRRRKPLKKSYLMLGGGVADCYQPLEKKYQLSRRVLELAYQFDFPVHVLTKSTLVTRDLDLLKKINTKNRAMVSFSFSGVDENISGILEPGVPSPRERLEVIAHLKKEGIACGLFLMPVIPFITDTPDQMADTIRMAREYGVDFIIFGSLTLKEGRQKQYFSDILAMHWPHLALEYQLVYPDHPWGFPSREYTDQVHYLFNRIVSRYKIPKRIPPALFQDILDENDRVVTYLEHLDYFAKLQGQSSPFGRAANAVAQIDGPLSAVRHELSQIKGIGPLTGKIILEILDRGRPSAYAQWTCQ